MKKNILMVGNIPIQYDSRAQRAAEMLSEKYSVMVLTLNGDDMYDSNTFRVESYENKWAKGFLLNFIFGIYIIYYSYRNRKCYDYLYILNYPIVIAGRISNILTGKKWIYDAYELILDRSKRLSIKRKFFVFLEKLSINNASLVVEANRERMRIIRYLYKINNITYVNNILKKLKNIECQSREDYIIYQGCVSKERDLSPFIDALDFIDTRISLKIIGNGDALDFYKRYVKDKGLDRRVIFTGRLPYSEVFKESVAGKVGILSYPLEGLNNYYCAPNKVHEYAQICLPMLTTPQPYLKHIMNKYHIGETLNFPLNKNDVAEKINKIYSRYDSYLNMKEFLCDYSFENEKERLLSAMSMLENI